MIINTGKNEFQDVYFIKIYLESYETKVIEGAITTFPKQLR